MLLAIGDRIGRLPEWARPVAWGALGFTALTAVRVVFGFAQWSRQPGGWATALGALATATGSQGTSVGRQTSASGIAATGVGSQANASGFACGSASTDVYSTANSAAGGSYAAKTSTLARLALTVSMSAALASISFNSLAQHGQDVSAPHKDEAQQKKVPSASTVYLPAKSA